MAIAKHTQKKEKKRFYKLYALKKNSFHLSQNHKILANEYNIPLDVLRHCRLQQEIYGYTSFLKFCLFDFFVPLYND